MSAISTGLVAEIKTAFFECFCLCCKEYICICGCIIYMCVLLMDLNSMGPLKHGFLKNKYV